MMLKPILGPTLDSLVVQLGSPGNVLFICTRCISFVSLEKKDFLLKHYAIYEAEEISLYFHTVFVCISYIAHYST